MSTALNLSIEEYERMVAFGSFSCLDRRIELIDGVLREMSPAGPVHDDLIEHLLTWSAPLVVGKLCKVRSQSGLVVGRSVPEPDFVLLRYSRYAKNRPTAKDTLLLVEVADTSLVFDLGEKANLYAQGDIKEYWVIDVLHRRLHRHLLPSDSGFRKIDQLDAHAVVKPQFSGSMELDLSALFLDETVE